MSIRIRSGLRPRQPRTPPVVIVVAWATAALVGPGGCQRDGSLVADSHPVSEQGQTAGVVGFDTPPDASGAQPPAPARMRTPAGRMVETGTRDSLGYILPLDIRRPRPPFEAPERPARSTIDRARRGSPTRSDATLFVEHRLGPDDGHTQNETTIDTHGDTVLAGWNNVTSQTVEMGVGRSLDGGETWTWSLLGGYTAASDPIVKAGRHGKWYYCYIATGGTGGSDLDVYVRTSLDGGSTWGAPTLVTQNGTFDDKPYMDARGDEVLLGWADFGFSPARVRAARSLDGGQSFGGNTVLANNSLAGNGACPVITSTGDYFMFWRDSWQESLWVSKSTDQGASWSADRGIVAMNPLPSSYPPGYRIVNLPSADADPVSGTLVVVWNDQRFGDPDILSIRSTDGGTTWSAPVRVNDDAGGAVQFFPWVTIDETGIVHVVWYDRRDNGFDIDVYYTHSLDGGTSYEPNVRVTAEAFTPILPWDTAVPFIGDYNGIAASASVVYPFYQDSREGNQDVYVAILPGVATGIAMGEQSIGAAAGVRLVASPSPFRGSTVIRLQSSAEEGSDRMSGERSALHGRTGVAVDIIAVDGRRVRQLTLDESAAAVWDGDDARGRPAPRGLYFARLIGAPGTTARLVKLD